MFGSDVQWYLGTHHELVWGLVMSVKTDEYRMMKHFLLYSSTVTHTSSSRCNESWASAYCWNIFFFLSKYKYRVWWILYLMSTEVWLDYIFCIYIYITGLSLLIFCWRFLTSVFMRVCSFLVLSLFWYQLMLASNLFFYFLKNIM